jgi:hypothetical protein
VKRAFTLIAAFVVIAGSAAAGDWKPVKIGGWGFLTGMACGIWRSTDEGATWTRLGDEYALGSLDTVNTIDGDKLDGRTVYVGFSGSGYAYYDLTTTPVP